MEADDSTNGVELKGIPVILQREEHTCVPTCIKMLLEFLSQKDTSLPNITIEEIAELMGTTALGTPVEGVDILAKELDKRGCFCRLNNLTNPNPSFREIRKSLAQGFPPLVFVNAARLQGDGSKKSAHAVLIYGIVPERNKLLYIDPYFGRREVDLGVFMESWEDALKVLFVVERSKKVQLRLNTYTGGEEQNAC